MPQNKFFRQLQQLWLRLTPRQRLIAGGGTLATVLLLSVLTHSLATPEMKPLMIGLEPADAQSIAANLITKKIGYQLTTDGKGINVPADQLDAARLAVAAEGPTRSGRLGFELFDKASWGQTEFDEKVNYQRALEGELERTIATLSDVKSARVHLVLSRTSVFLDRDRGAKASVTLRLKHGSLSSDQLESISRLVSGAVEDLAPADVAIVDADTNQFLGHKTTDQAQELEQQLSKRLVTTLSPAVGSDNLRASVNIEYDLTTSEENQDKYDPAISAVLTSQKSSEQATNGDAAGVAGSSANTPAANGSTPAADTSTGGQVSSSESSTFGVNKIARHTVSPAGRVRRITAAILVNDLMDHKMVGGKWVDSPRKRSQAQLKQLQSLAEAVLGSDPQRGDVVTLEDITFDDGHAPDLPLTMAEKIRQGASNYSSALHYAGLAVLLLVVYLLMVRPVQKQLLSGTRELGAGSATTEALPSTAQAASLVASVVVDEGVTTDLGSPVLKRQIAELVQAEPVAMTRTVQAWLREDPA